MQALKMSRRGLLLPHIVAMDQFTDDFNRSNGAFGNGWTDGLTSAGDSITPAFGINSNGAGFRGSGSSGTQEIAYRDFGHVDHSVSAVFYGMPASGGFGAGVIARGVTMTSPSSYWLLRILKGSLVGCGAGQDQVRLEKRVGGTQTNIYAVCATLTYPVTITLSFIGNNWTLDYGGVQSSGTDSANNTGTKVGLFTQGSALTDGKLLDNFVATQLA